MDSLVFQARHELQILDPVIELVAIDMMYVHAGGFRAKMILPNHDVFHPQASLTPNADSAITEFGHRASRWRICPHRMVSSRGFIGIGDVPVRSNMPGVPEKR